MENNTTHQYGYIMFLQIIIVYNLDSELIRVSVETNYFKVDKWQATNR